MGTINDYNKMRHMYLGKEGIIEKYNKYLGVEPNKEGKFS